MSGSVISSIIQYSCRPACGRQCGCVFRPSVCRQTTDSQYNVHPVPLLSTEIITSCRQEVFTSMFVVNSCGIIVRYAESAGTSYDGELCNSAFTYLLVEKPRCVHICYRHVRYIRRVVLAVKRSTENSGLENAVVYFPLVKRGSITVQL